LQVFPARAGEGFFPTLFMLDDIRPEAGDAVLMIEYGELTVSCDPEVPNKGLIERRLVIRAGHVEEFFPDGHILIRGPCVQTTIPIHFGMSGGIVAAFPGVGQQIRPFALISHAPDPQPINDRSESGHSVGALIGPKIERLEINRQKISINLNNMGVGRGS